MSKRSLKEKQRIRHLAYDKRQTIDAIRLLDKRGPKIWVGQPGNVVEVFDLKKDTADGKLYRRNATNDAWVELADA